MPHRQEQVRGSAGNRQDHLRTRQPREEEILRRFGVNLVGRHFG